MGTFSKALTISMMTATAALGSSVTTGGAPLLESPKVMRSMAWQKSGDHGTPAIAGIKLLEDIFVRLHNLPQLASKLSNTQTLIASASGAQTDPMLAIKPPEVMSRNSRARVSSLEKIAFYKAPRELQILDDRAAVRDFRDSTNALEEQGKREEPRASNARRISAKKRA